MNGLEALNAMKEGKIVRTKYGRLYRMKDNLVKYNCAGKWEFTEIELNDWINYDYELSPEPVEEPVEYNLTFSEAMCEAAQGSIVCNEEYPSMKHYMKDGKLCCYDDIVTGLQEDEVRAKWRVVEEGEE